MKLALEKLESVVSKVVSTQPEPLNQVNVSFLVESWKKLMELGLGSGYHEDETGFLLSLFTLDLITGQMQGSNFLWMVKPGSRGVALRLLKEFEAEAKTRECKFILSGCIEAARPKEMARLYAKMGYKPFSSSFCKKA